MICRSLLNWTKRGEILIKLRILVGLFFVALFWTNPCFSSNEQHLRDLIIELKSEVSLLREEVRRISKKTVEGWGGVYKNTKKWGCYINDINPGHVFSTGATKPEAIRKLLGKCTARNRVCFENRIKCSTR